MPQMQTVAGRWFFHFVRLRRLAPFYHQYRTQEIAFPGQPDRSGMGHIFHLPPFKLSLVIGKWTDKDGDLIGAIGGEDLGDWLPPEDGQASGDESDTAQPEVRSGEAIPAGGNRPEASGRSSAEADDFL